jgi:omega-amidase
MEDLRITLVQSTLAWEDISANLDHFSQLLEDLSGKDTDLIILPEMFTTGFTMNAAAVAETMDGKALDWMRLQAGKKNVTITGSLVIKENGTYYNRLVWMSPEGLYRTYDKRHLFRMAGEEKVYSAGGARIIVNLKGWNICPLICYDLRFPVWSRNIGSYDVLLYIANWPEKRSYAWKQLLIARAIENQCYVAGVNRVGTDGKDNLYSGDSLAVSPKGEVIGTAKPYEEELLTVPLSYKDLDDYRKQFPVHLDADKFLLI